MATAKDKLNKIIENFNEIELSEVVDFAEFINEKREKVFKETSSSESISYNS